jgi:peptidoglycan/xylan/chitin deacetylase (PgdA/CDA1 family)
LRPLSGETNGNQGSYDGDPPDRESSPGPVARRELLFTFDDGPHLDGTPQVLAQLERHKIRAIFFVNGRHLVGHDPAALQRRAILRRVVAAGHLVANHTMNHVDLCRDPTAIEAEIDGNAEVIAATTGKRPVLFRSPYGSRCRRLVEALRLRHLTEVGWNVGGNELDSPDENDIVEDVAAKLGHRAGPAILLLHDSHPSAVKALPWILDFVDEQNQRLRAAGKEPWKIVGPEVLLR